MTNSEVNSHRRALSSLLTGALLVAGAAACEQRPAEPDALIRVDQVGYATTETKTAVLLAPRDAAGAHVKIIDSYGKTVLTPKLGDSRGAWNPQFPDVRPLDLTPLAKHGTYRIRVEGTVTAESPPFHVTSAPEMFAPLARDSLQYFQAHRDGADQVPGLWRRQPSHLADRQATVYERPAFDDAGKLTGDLEPADGPVDVEGGWFDAGDFLKFTHTTAYAVSAMLIAQRDGLLGAGIEAETRHGVDWLDKMWDTDSATLYTQVGIGSGRYTGGNGFLGDHDAWRLPETDDQLAVAPGDPRYYQRNRPVFRAAEPGEPISPNLAGRVGAAFALAAQVESGTDRKQATDHLQDAARIFARARTSDVGELVTAEPANFYPEDRWTDDLALAATELALAGRLLGDARAAGWARQATYWAKLNTDQGGTGPLGVYDTSALADAELVRLLTDAPVAGARIDKAGLLGDLRRRLAAGVQAADGNPMRAAAGNGGSDYAARQLGYAATAELYEHVSGDPQYAAFATTQRGVVLGVNGWGTSLVVGAGSTYPRCPHDQIATLAKTTATSLGMTGAVVNGPNRAERVHELLAQPGGPVTCGTDTFAVFDRDDAHYADDMRVSANTEPSIDFSATGMLAFALMAKQH